MLKIEYRLSLLTFFMALTTSCLITTGTIWADPYYHVSEAVSPINVNMVNLHTLTSLIAIGIMVIVTGVIVLSVSKYTKVSTYKTDTNTPSRAIRIWPWALIPVLVLAISLSITGQLPWL
ncbi:MAG: hypothetical protein GY928_22905 [Colwellia sp.]|nr:hypothetical protein [Colwellia sp.]